MYYNIKIKSNGSEFSLESNNKDITQKEMDRYFAHIFDASEEFKSKIKKIEITNENLKSIEEIENINKPKEELSQENKIEQNEINNKTIDFKDKEIIEIKNEQPQKEEIKEIELIQPKAIEEVELIQPKPTEEIKFQNETKIISIKDDIKTNTSDDANSTYNDDIAQLISLAQQKIDSLDSKNKELQKLTENNDIVDIKPKQNDEKEQHHQSNQEILNDIFNIPTPKPTDFEDTQENNVQTPQIKNTNINNTNYEPEISLADIEISLQNEENNQEVINSIEQNEQQIQQQAEQINTTTIEPIEPIEHSEATAQNARMSLSQRASQMDFKPFLSGFICDGITDEFIVCAYFIKNVLKQSDFTIKYINSKLFQATGKIADLSVIDELVSKEYIRIIDTEEGKKYCITMDGESYFAEKFQ